MVIIVLMCSLLIDSKCVSLVLCIVVLLVLVMVLWLLFVSVVVIVLVELLSFFWICVESWCCVLWS